VGLKLVKNQTWLVCLVTFQLYWLVWLVQALKSPEKKSAKILMHLVYTASSQQQSLWNVVQRTYPDIGWFVLVSPTMWVSF
jgi:hypothetical protein